MTANLNTTASASPGGEREYEVGDGELEIARVREHEVGEGEAGG